MKFAFVPQRTSLPKKLRSNKQLGAKSTSNTPNILQEIT